jgi:chemotaxis protein MotB
MASFEERPIIIKKVKKAAHGHHGGAWKIAYADFVTAMMAFFLLLWLISMTTPEQKEGLAQYFAPGSISPTTSGAGGLMGGTALGQDGAMMAGTAPGQTSQQAVPPKGEQFGTEDGADGSDSGETGATETAAMTSQFDLASSQDQEFHSAAASIRQAWQAMPDITEMADNLILEETKDGINIRIIDQEGSPMFPEGSKYPVEPARAAIAAIAPVLQRLAAPVRISGHTAAGGAYANPRYGAWELSTDRANVVRGILGEFGLADDRVDAVLGRATAEPFFMNDPYMAANERIEITVLKEAPPVPAGLTP